MIVCIVGGMGVGKTTLVKNEFLSKCKKDKIIFCLIPDDFSDYSSYVICEYEDFILRCNKVKDTLIIIDEAKAVIPYKEPNVEKKIHKQLMNFLLNSRKLNNFVIFVYHSLRDVPIWLLTYTNFFLRFKTNDLMQIQKMRFASFPLIVESIENHEIKEIGEYQEIRLR